MTASVASSQPNHQFICISMNLLASRQDYAYRNERDSHARHFELQAQWNMKHKQYIHIFFSWENYSEFNSYIIFHTEKIIKSKLSSSLTSVHDERAHA